MFTVLDSSNTARVTLTDPRPAHWATRAVDTLADPRSIDYTVACFAQARGIPARRVEVAIEWPAERVQL